MHSQKIATCCYCGTRSLLRLTARDGHELACASCGAPLHNMKPLRVDRRSGEMRRKGYPDDLRGPARHPSAKRKKKRKPSPLWRLLEEVADVVEDIID